MDALRTVVVGTDLGSFARAAVQLGRSQSAVSMHLKKLEQQTGTVLFRRSGRGLVPTEAGEAFIAYARRIIALNDEAALSMGAATTTASVRLGVPQDFFDDVMPATLRSFSKEYDTVHVDIRTGENHSIAEDVRAGRLDAAIAFVPPGSPAEGETLCHLPMRWLATADTQANLKRDPLPLVLFTHPCLFRQIALATLDKSRMRWRAALTTPSLPAVWSALRSGLGIAVRTDPCEAGRYCLPWKGRCASAIAVNRTAAVAQTGYRPDCRPPGADPATGNAGKGDSWQRQRTAPSPSPHGRHHMSLP